MNGRWTIRKDEIRRDEITGPDTGFDTPPVPVVPCDDAAIERVAYALCTDPVVGLFEGLSNGDTDRDYPKLIAEAVFRAAKDHCPPHDYQTHPEGEDHGVCSRCGTEDPEVVGRGRCRFCNHEMAPEDGEGTCCLDCATDENGEDRP